MGSVCVVAVAVTVGVVPLRCVEGECVPSLIDPQTVAAVFPCWASCDTVTVQIVLTRRFVEATGPVNGETCLGSRTEVNVIGNTIAIAVALGGCATVSICCRCDGRQRAEVSGVSYAVFIAVDVLLLCVAAKGVDGSEINGVWASILVILDAIVVAVKLVQCATNAIDRRTSIGVRALIVVVTHAIAVHVVEHRASLPCTSRNQWGTIGHAWEVVALICIHACDVVTKAVTVGVIGLGRLKGKRIVLVGTPVTVGIWTTVERYWITGFIQARGRIPKRTQTSVQR